MLGCFGLFFEGVLGFEGFEGFFGVGRFYLDFREMSVYGCFWRILLRRNVTWFYIRFSLELWEAWRSRAVSSDYFKEFRRVLYYRANCLE